MSYASSIRTQARDDQWPSHPGHHSSKGKGEPHVWAMDSQVGTCKHLEAHGRASVEAAWCQMLTFTLFSCGCFLRQSQLHVVKISVPHHGKPMSVLPPMQGLCRPNTQPPTWACTAACHNATLVSPGQPRVPGCKTHTGAGFEPVTFSPLGCEAERRTP